VTVHSIGNFTDLIEESADFCGGRVYRSGAPRSMKMGTIARCAAIMQRPPTRSDRITSDGLRSCATPHGRLSSDFAGVRLLFGCGHFDQSRERRDGPKAGSRASIILLASKSHRLCLQPEDGPSESAGLPLSRQSASDRCHSSLERNCLRRGLRCCYLPRLSNTFRSRLLCRRPFLCFPQGTLPQGIARVFGAI